MFFKILKSIIFCSTLENTETMGSKYSRKLQQEEAATLTRGVHKHLPAHQHKNYGMKLKYERYEKDISGQIHKLMFPQRIV